MTAVEFTSYEPNLLLNFVFQSLCTSLKARADVFSVSILSVKIVDAHLLLSKSALPP